jgi:hypothetical protein
MEGKQSVMENDGGRSIERIGFAAMAALVLAPILVQAIWALVSLMGRFPVDAYALSLGAVAVTGAAVAGLVVLQRRSILLRMLVAVGLGMVVGLLVGWEMEGKIVVALVLGGLGAGMSGFVPWFARRLPVDMDGAAKNSKVKAVLLVLLSLLSIFQTTKLSAFMGDAQRMELSMIPEMAFLKNHSCFTSYVHAVKLAQAGEKNLYDQRLWPDELALSKKREVALNDSGPYAPFFLDNYMYPPQFLLLPGAITAVSSDFMVQRALWFSFCALFLAVGFWIVAKWVSTEGRRHAIWLIPLLWSSMVVLVTLQVGNVHHVVMVMAVLAMVAFEGKQPALGGGLLAFSIIAKISPGILVIVLLVQRRWRDLGWTLGFGVLFTLLGILFFGVAPVESFLTYQLPRIASGESMKWFSSLTTNVVINTGPFSIPFKLAALGMPIEDPWAVAGPLNKVYTLLIVVLAVILGRQQRDRRQSLYLWVSLLMLSSLQSPFSPGYVMMPMLWLLTLLAAEVKSVKGTVAWAVVWMFLAFPVPLPDGPALVMSLVQQGLMYGVIVWALMRKMVVAR